jgi:hypothetical protein
VVVVTLSPPLACFLAALALGAGVEAIARLLRLWTYRSPALLGLNVVVVFGLLQGYGVGWIVGGRHALGGVFPVLFMVGAVLGILIEGLNEFWLHAWTWSSRPLLGIVRSIDKAAFAGFTWGFAPLLTVLLARVMTTQLAGA